MDATAVLHSTVHDAEKAQRRQQQRCVTHLPGRAPTAAKVRVAQPALSPIAMGWKPQGGFLGVGGAIPGNNSIGWGEGKPIGAPALVVRRTKTSQFGPWATGTTGWQRCLENPVLHAMARRPTRNWAGHGVQGRNERHSAGPGSRSFPGGSGLTYYVGVDG